MNSITIKIIYDNCKIHEEFQEGWGFSCLVDLGNRKILFDSGANVAAFFSNLEKFCIKCEDITDIVYSHKHADHISGLEEIVRMLKKGSRLFLPKKFPSKKIPSTVEVERIEDFKKIDSRAYTLVLKGGFFFYEQALLIDSEKGVIVIVGCAHPGIIQLLEQVKQRLNRPIYLVLGGFHLFRSKQHHIDSIIDQFKSLGVEKAAPCHCCGDLTIHRFQSAFQENFYKVGAGTTLTIP